jgi:phospholipid/cholesterol/gamma-HCH transport system ATP-binding protein
VIKIQDLYKSFPGEDVLNGVNLSIPSGEMTALLGASGSGKSVLLRNIVGLMVPDKGSVTIDGMSVHSSDASTLETIREKIGMLFQGGALFDSMTVYENLAFPLQEKTSLTRNEIEEKVIERLSLVGMEDSRDKYPAELSGGMQKRVALARSLITDPEFIFFDEPTTGLDPLIANSILRLIHRLNNQLSFTAIIVTHNFYKVFPIVQKVAMLHDGEIVEHTIPSDFKNSDQPAVQEFVREAMEGPLEGVDNGHEPSR